MTDIAAPLKFVTIGVYGFTEAAFFAALQRAGVDTFCDIRYLHFRELAPSPALRQRQVEADKLEGTTKRKRTALGEVFVQGYCAERLAAFDSAKFVELLGAGAKVVALFCVEREPAACHRSLLAARLQRDLGFEARHLLPE